VGKYGPAWEATATVEGSNHTVVVEYVENEIHLHPVSSAEHFAQIQHVQVWQFMPVKLISIHIMAVRCSHHSERLVGPGGNPIVRAVTTHLIERCAVLDDRKNAQPHSSQLRFIKLITRISS
jgi:hypothetical protein